MSCNEELSQCMKSQSQMHEVLCSCFNPFFFRYLTSKIGMEMNKYYLPVVVCVGVVGNILALLVMLQENNKRISCCVYLAALAVSDHLFLYVGAHFWIMSVPLAERFREPVCK